MNDVHIYLDRLSGACYHIVNDVHNGESHATRGGHRQVGR